MMQQVRHGFEPVIDGASRVLVLGTMPSPASRENGFYYGHPRNRFWKVIARLFMADEPVTVEQKRALLLDNGIALWDVLKSCDINGASDASIRNAVANDIAGLMENSGIRAIFFNGTEAARLFRKLCHGQGAGLATIALPSTSPANAAYSLERLCSEYSCMLEYW